MNPTPENILQLCNEECEKAWKEFSTHNVITESTSPQAISMAKIIFRAGFLSGADFVGSTVLNKIKSYTP